MTRQQIIKDLKKYFNVKELVCNHVYSRWGEASWDFLDTDYLHSLLIIRRDILQQEMVCNNNTATQRGLRCNLCNIVKSKYTLYLSAHVLGKAGDFTIKNMTAEEARNKIKSHSHLLPCAVRLEKNVDWLHFDVRSQEGSLSKIFEF